MNITKALDSITGKSSRNITEAIDNYMGNERPSRNIMEAIGQEEGRTFGTIVEMIDAKNENPRSRNITEAINRMTGTVGNTISGAITASNAGNKDDGVWEEVFSNVFDYMSARHDDDYDYNAHYVGGNAIPESWYESEKEDLKLQIEDNDFILLKFNGGSWEANHEGLHYVFNSDANIIDGFADDDEPPYGERVSFKLFKKVTKTSDEE